MVPGSYLGKAAACNYPALQKETVRQLPMVVQCKENVLPLHRHLSILDQLTTERNFPLQTVT